MGVEDRNLWIRVKVAGCDQGRTLEVPKVPLYHLARIIGDHVAPLEPGEKRTNMYGIEVPLPMNDGRVSRCCVHRMLSHSAVGMYERVVFTKNESCIGRERVKMGTIFFWC